MSTVVDRQYEDLLRRIMETGVDRDDRTGTGTRSVFGAMLRYDLSQRLPVVTTKRIHLRSVIYELLWFLRGESNVRWLREHGVTIWDEWADKNGELGPVYGVQWREWKAPDGRTIDQIAQTMDLIKNDPNSRRIVVSAWNVAELPAMALSPCHMMFQFYVANGKLSCLMYQRSGDSFLGVPFNITSYALLTHMFAQQTGLEPGELVWVGGDCHIYQNHFEQVATQLEREPFPFPTLNLTPAPSISDYAFEDFEVVNYRHHPGIAAPIAV